MAIQKKNGCCMQETLKCVLTGKDRTGETDKWSSSYGTTHRPSYSSILQQLAIMTLYKEITADELRTFVHTHTHTHTHTYIYIT